MAFPLHSGLLVCDTKYCYSFHTLYCMRRVKQCKQRLSSIENGRYCQKEKSKLVGGYTCGVLDIDIKQLRVCWGEENGSFVETDTTGAFGDFIFPESILQQTMHARLKMDIDKDLLQLTIVLVVIK